MARTSVDLYRIGNKTSARLDQVRANEIVTFQKNGTYWVRGRAGGASTWEAKAPGLTGTWWSLPAGALYDDQLLVVWSDATSHWLWEAAYDMPLSDYKTALSRVNADFIPA